MENGSRYHVFISYSHHDLLWCDRVARRLSELSADRNIHVFIDKDIPTGKKWQEALECALNDARVVVFLVSAAWAKSKHCRRELQHGLGRWRSEGLNVVWVPIDGHQSRELQKLQAACNRNQPLGKLRDDRLINAAIADVCESILDQLDPLRRRLQARLPDRYRLIRRIGEGTSSVVYLAADLSLERRVTVRTVKESHHNDEFAASVRRAAQLGRHPAFMTVYGAWLDDDPYCCVMDYIDGKSLRSHLDRRTWRWDANDAVELVLKIGEALAGAHAKGFHHRDLRPSKIIVDDDNNAFICGITRADNAIGDALLERARDPRASFTLTPEQAHYIAPEHCYPLDESDMEEQSDQYQLGLIAYEVLSRQLPPTLRNPREEVMRGDLPLFQPLPALHHAVPGCPHALGDVIAKMVSICPRDRYAHLPEGLDALRALLPITLTFARESYHRCIATPGRERAFFRSFYDEFRGQCPEGGALFQRFGKVQWERQFRMLKEGVLLLFAYAGSSPAPQREPNVLTRIAQEHGRGGLRVKRLWYEQFAAALVKTACERDPECRDKKRYPFIEQAWQSTLEPGIRYVKLFCAR